MKIKRIHLFFILVAALILCSCLGGSNIFEGFSSNGHPKKPVGGCEGTEYGCCPDNTTAKNEDGSNCPEPVGGCISTQYGCCPDNTTAKNQDGSNCNQPQPPQPQPQPQPQPEPQPQPQPQPQSSVSASTYTGPAGNSATAITGPQGNTAVITGSDIPPGDEDLYILKSEVIPPVCPACPTVSSCPSQEPPPPCPPCARCPEPSFECKKVPNYSTNNDQYLPRPVLADFSQFGM